MSPVRFYVVLNALLASLLLIHPLVARADSFHDHDQARQALESGQILSLRSILDLIEPAFPGQVLEVELEGKHGALIYELKVLQAGGMMIKLKVDAKNGKVLGTKQDASK